MSTYMVAGECMHLVNSFLCMEGEFQNYPCPYRFNFCKCRCFVRVTPTMAKAWNEKGVVVLRREDIPYDPLDVGGTLSD